MTYIFVKVYVEFTVFIQNALKLSEIPMFLAVFSRYEYIHIHKGKIQDKRDLLRNIRLSDVGDCYVNLLRGWYSELKVLRELK